MAKLLAEKAQETGARSATRSAQSLRAPPRAPGRRRGSRRDDRKHRRRVLEDRHHLRCESRRARPAVVTRVQQLAAATEPRADCRVLHRRHHRRHRDAAGPRRHRRGAPERARRASRSRGADRARARPRAAPRDVDAASATCTRGVAATRAVRGARRSIRSSSTYFPAPASYTGDDVVELSAHGSPVVLRAIVAAAIGAGARLAEPGEFTLRAFLNGRIDLMQAEAVADLDRRRDAAAGARGLRSAGGHADADDRRDRCRALRSDRAARGVGRFSGRGLSLRRARRAGARARRLARAHGALLADARRGRLVREGLQVAIVGKPNVGKSSLFNALVGAARAIVTDVPGTTRDLVTEDGRSRRPARDARRHRRASRDRRTRSRPKASRGRGRRRRSRT